jgi:uncharacterized RDD family membrane protein YckC
VAESVKIRQIVTPEGVALPFEIASPIDRLAAFAVDFFLVHVVVAAIVVLGVFSTGANMGAHGMSLALLSSFFLRNFYFTYFEVRWSGATIGKRKLGLRVISRDGGPLTTEAVFARNLTREIEVFLPLAALGAPQAVLPGLPAWAALIGVVWLMIFAVLPLLGRDHLRIGDMLGGTLVVRMPEARLMEDLAEFHAGAFSGRGVRPDEEERYRFTRGQLDLYGIKELQVLEDLLRRSQGRKEMDVVEAVAERIKKKIRWPRDQWKTDDWSFLTAFYKAQRARLEHKMLFGKRQREKKK